MPISGTFICTYTYMNKGRKYILCKPGFHHSSQTAHFYHTINIISLFEYTTHTYTTAHAVLYTAISMLSHYVITCSIDPLSILSLPLVFRNEKMLLYLRQSMEMVSGLADALRGVPASNRTSVRRQLKRTRSDIQEVRRKPTMRYVSSLSFCSSHVSSRTCVPLHTSLPSDTKDSLCKTDTTHSTALPWYIHLRVCLSPRPCPAGNE